MPPGEGGCATVCVRECGSGCVLPASWCQSSRATPASASPLDPPWSAARSAVAQGRRTAAPLGSSAARSEPCSGPTSPAGPSRHRSGSGRDSPGPQPPPRSPLGALRGSPRVDAAPSRPNAALPLSQAPLQPPAGGEGQAGAPLVVQPHRTHRAATSVTASGRLPGTPRSHWCTHADHAPPGAHGGDSLGGCAAVGRQRGRRCGLLSWAA